MLCQFVELIFCALTELAFQDTTMASIDTNALQSLLPQAVIQFAMENDDPPPLKSEKAMLS